MKTIGLVGGITYVSSIDYYRMMNEMINERVGGATSAKVLINSINFAEVKAFTIAEDWASLAKMIGKAAQTRSRLRFTGRQYHAPYCQRGAGTNTNPFDSYCGSYSHSDKKAKPRYSIVAGNKIYHAAQFLPR
jgi:hypothetical protein